MKTFFCGLVFASWSLCAEEPEDGKLEAPLIVEDKNPGQKIQFEVKPPKDDAAEKAINDVFGLAAVGAFLVAAGQDSRPVPVESKTSQNLVQDFWDRKR